MPDDESKHGEPTPDLMSIADQRVALLLQMGPFITRLFRDPLVEGLVEPAMLIALPTEEDQPVKAIVVERLELMAMIASMPVVSETPGYGKRGVEILVASPDRVTSHTIPDPRLNPN